MLCETRRGTARPVVGVSLAMDAVFLQLAGFGLLILVAWDVFVTTLTVRGGGPVSRRVARGVWASLLAIHRRRECHSLLSFGGGLALSIILFVWVAMLLGAWGLVFAGTPNAVVDASTNTPASLAARLYYAGFNLFTLGLGDYRPVGVWGQTLTVVASGSGLLGITLAVAYLAPVLSGAVTRQALAAEIGLLGASPRRIIEGARRQGLEAFSQRLNGLAGAILKSSEQHLAYPILHDFHACHRRLVLPLRLAALYDALIVLDATGSDAPPTLISLAEAIELFLSRVRNSVAPSTLAEAPPAPDIAGLGFDEERVTSALRQRSEARAYLHELVQHDGWAWSDLSAED